MAAIDDIKQRLMDHWYSDPALPLCIKIVDFLVAAPADELQMLTYKSLARAAGKKDVDSDVLRAVLILVTSTAKVLDVNGLFIDEYLNEYHISSDELAQATKTGSLIHPESGDPIRNFEANLVPYFTAVEELRRKVERHS